MGKVMCRDGGLLAFDEIGSGRPVILLHSLLADRASFRSLAEQLADRHHVIMPSLPGFGGSDSVEGGISSYADRIALLPEALGLSQTPALLGNGFGGFVALAAAARHSASFDRVILADTGMAFDAAGRQTFRVMADKVAAGGMETVLDAAILRLFPEDYIAASPEVVSRCREALMRIAPDSFIQACAALAELDLRDEAAWIKEPVQVVVGQLDAATPPAMARELAERIEGARFSQLEGVGHAPHIQATKELAEIVLAFLVAETEAAPQRADAI